MIIARSLSRLTRALAQSRARKKTVSFVPTMGSLHAGHGACVTRARRAAETCVVSIFVNPLQFDSKSDLAAYPRTTGRDVELLSSWGVDVVYLPSVRAMYPTDFSTSIRERHVSRMLEGRARPGHFDGVLTVVAKLFAQVRPDVAVFGEKDFQQAWLIRRMARDLDLGPRILTVPTVRARDGVALSSRLARIDLAARIRARAIHAGLIAARRACVSGERRVSELARIVRAALRREQLRADYIVCVDESTFAPAVRLAPRIRYRLLTASRVGSVRLIDNIAIGAPAR